MANTKVSLADIGEILSQKGSEFTFQDPARVDVPNTELTDLSGNARQIPDPTNTLKPALGIERIRTNSLSQKNNEKGPNGELVYELSNRDSRFRFVGRWAGYAAVSAGPGNGG